MRNVPAYACIDASYKTMFKDADDGQAFVVFNCILFFLQYEMTKIPRSREVHQSWSSTVFTSFVASVYSVILVFKSRPDLVSILLANELNRILVRFSELYGRCMFWK